MPLHSTIYIERVFHVEQAYATVTITSTTQVTLQVYRVLRNVSRAYVQEQMFRILVQFIEEMSVEGFSFRTV